MTIIVYRITKTYVNPITVDVSWMLHLSNTLTYFLEELKF